MEARANSSPPARSHRERVLPARPSPQLVTYVALWTTILLLLGCGSSLHTGDPSSSSLVVGERAAPIPPAQLALATRTARRFGAAYAAAIYLPHPPPLPGASRAVDRDIAAAATHIPLGRRARHPHAAEVSVEPSAPELLGARVLVDDGISTPFTIGFRLRRQGSRWIVVSVSSPE
jgi:hypothetical protein